MTQITGRLLLGTVTVVVLGALPLSGLAEEVVERFPNGNVAKRYNTTNGAKNGKYEAFYEDGKKKGVAYYKDGKLSGPYNTYHENGRPAITATYLNGEFHGQLSKQDSEGQTVLVATYQNGQLNGVRTVYRGGAPSQRQLWKDNELVGLDGVKTHPFTRVELRAALEKINKSPAEKASFSADQIAAVQRLNAYRLVCGAPADVTLDAKQCFHAQKGAELLSRVGRLDHHPKNPGLPEDEYQAGYTGTSKSNIHLGRDQANLTEAVDWFMNDSDSKNVNRVGHRRWCLNPAMLTTGFGNAESYACMWAMDKRRKRVRPWKYICFPARGLMPTDLFRADYAWSISLSKKHFGHPASGVQVSIRRLDENLMPGPEERVQDVNVSSMKRYALANTIIFRPENIDVQDGAKYWVEIQGLKTTRKKPATVRYLVEFIDLDAKADVAKEIP